LQLGLLRLPDPQDPVSLDDLYEFNAALLQEQRARYDQLVEKYEPNLVRDIVVEAPTTTDIPTEHDHHEPPAAAAAADEMLDPLTAMLKEQEAKEKRRQELDLKYRKERARRKRGIYEGEGADGHGDVSESFEIIDKDLHRLQPEHYTYHHSRKRLLQQEQDFNVSHGERTALLAELLQIHAREHAALGYRQGMHEIGSYLVLVIEMDLYDLESTALSSGVAEDERSCGILNAEYLRHDAFAMLERVMTFLSPAYDIKQSPNQSSSPMETMGRSIVAKLKDTASDEALWQTVKHMHCPPELYCTRWVRLMFSREVLGWRNVLLLWDIFMDLMTAHESIKSMEPSKYSKPGASLQLGQFTLMEVLETTAASMILLQRDALLEADPNESIHILMNVAPLTNIVPLTATLLSMMRRQQNNGNNNDLSSSVASLSSAFGQLARDAFSQIAPTAGESLRKLSAGESLRKLYNGNTPKETPLPPPPSTSLASPLKHHPLAAQSESRNERPPEFRKQSLPPQHVKEVAKSRLTMPDPLAEMSQPEAGKGQPSSVSPEKHLIPSQREKEASNSMSNALKASTSTISDFLVQVNSSGATSSVPEAVWEALAQVEAVRQQLLQEP
jgi:TBC1 domain family protein 5